MNYLLTTWKTLIEISESVLIGLLFFFALNLMLQNYVVRGDSMIPNYESDQRVLVLKFSYIKNILTKDIVNNPSYFLEPFDPHRGDIVVFKYPSNVKRKFVKRIIGLPGDNISIRNGFVFVNNIKIKEPYLESDKYRGYDNFGPVTVEPNHIFVLGDNRRVSNDSRNWGQVSYDFVIGKPFIKYWPLVD
tara:strand:- start:1151 stop:1717 length:567 start_codon:yes stop_codon:yes gene_type:complete